MAGNKDPHRFAGKMGINTGPIPIGRWQQQPSVNANRPLKDVMPDAGKPRTANKGTRKGESQES